MKVSPIQQQVKPNFITVNHKVKPYAYSSKAPSFKGMSGSIGGLCLGGVLGYAASIGTALLGLPVGMLAFLGFFLGGAFGGAYLGNKAEDAIDKKLNSPKK